MCDTASRDWDRGTRAIVTIRTSPPISTSPESRTTQCSDCSTVIELGCIRCQMAAQHSGRHRRK